MKSASDDLKIARINAWQTIIVAAIGAIAGIGGTVGVQYLSESTRLADSARALAEQEEKLARLERELNQPPYLELRLAAVSLGPADCERRAHDWYSRQESRRPASSYDGKYRDGVVEMSLSRFELQVVCPNPGAPAVVAVSAGPPFARGDADRMRQLAAGLMSALARP